MKLAAANVVAIAYDGRFIASQPPRSTVTGGCELISIPLGSVRVTPLETSLAGGKRQNVNNTTT